MKKEKQLSERRLYKSFQQSGAQNISTLKRKDLVLSPFRPIYTYQDLFVCSILCLLFRQWIIHINVCNYYFVIQNQQVDFYLKVSKYDYYRIQTMTEISNETLLDITQLAFQSFKSKRKVQALDPNQLKEFKESKIKPLYLRKPDQNNNLRKYFCGEACCEESPGSFLCTQRQPDQSFVKYGLGICLYFNSLKHSSCFYLIMSLFAITACSICFAVAVQNDFNPLSNYNTFFFSSTYGTYGSEHNKCQYSKIDSITNTASFSVSCPYGTLNKFGTVFTLQSLDSLHNCYNQRKKQNLNQSSTSGYIISTTQNCNSNGTSCSMSVLFNGLQTYSLVSYTYECLDNVYSLGSIKANSSQFLYITVSIDIFFCLCYLIFLIIENVSQNRQENYFKTNQLTLSDFTIQVEGLYRNTADKQLLQLVKYMNQKCEVPVEDNLFSYTLPECQQMISTHYKQRQAYQNIYKLINKYYFNCEKASQDFKQCHKNVLEQVGQAQYQEFRKELRHELQQFKNFKRKQIYKQSFEALPLHLVFNKIHDKQKVLALQQKTCCSNKLTVEARQYHFKQAPLPDMILWQNRNKWTKTRTFFSWIVTIVLCLCSYMLFGFIQLKQAQLLSTYKYNIDCNVLYTSAQLNTFNSALSSQVNYQTCICKNKSLTQLATDSASFCSTWQKQYVLYLIIPLLISIGIVIYNVTISYVFKFLTKFQKHKFVVDEEISYTFKRAFLLILNMGVIMTLLNLNFNTNNINSSQVSFIFAGQYDGFTADWYSVIGSIIIMTMIFNIAFPIIELCLTSLLKGLTKLWDTRCCRVPTSRSTKAQYLSLYSDDIFPIGQRYAYLIATLFVSLGFCGVIPILIPVTAISLFLLYFADKILLFKIYQIPINYTKSLHSILSKMIFVALLVHFSFTAYLLAEPTLIANNAGNTPSLITSGSARLNSMFSVNYIIPYSVIFLLMVVFLILKIFVYDLFSKCIELVKNSFIQPEQKFQQLQLVKLLDKRQINTLIKISQLNLQTIQLRRNESLFQTFRATSERQFTEQIASQEQMLGKSMFRLQQEYRKKANVAQLQKVTLLGQPSYEYLIKNNQFQKFEEMVEFQRKLLNGGIKNKENSTGFSYKKKPDQSQQNLKKVIFEVADP